MVVVHFVLTLYRYLPYMVIRMIFNMVLNGIHVLCMYTPFLID